MNLIKRKTMRCQRQDPCDQNIDHLVVAIKGELKELSLFPFTERPFSDWCRKRLPAVWEINPEFNYRLIQPRDEILQREWQKIYSKVAEMRYITEDRQIFEELRIDLLIDFEKLAGFSVPGAYTHQQYIGLFIYDGQGLEPVPLLTIRRKFLSPLFDPFEIISRYQIPQLKPLFDLVRSRTGKLEQALMRMS